jgi:hypothetical protein
MTLLRAALLLLLAAPLPTSVQAQTLQDLQLLQSQGALIEQLRGARAADPSPRNGNSGVPTSNGAATLNADDAARDPNLLVQSTAPVRIW